MLFYLHFLFMYYCIPSFIYVQSKVFIKMQRIFASLSYSSSICQFPPTALENYLDLRLCKFVFLCFSLICSLGCSRGAVISQQGKYKYLCCTGPITHPDSFCELYVLHISIHAVTHLILIAAIQVTNCTKNA